MSDINYISIFIAFAGGLGMFLYGMHIMASGLQKTAGNKMKKILEILTKNKFMGVIVGAGVTAIIQSSSATTVMVVGFVNAGLMNLSQTVGIIMGANIGTTVTGWIVSSVEWAEYLKPTTFAPISVAIGAVFVLFAKKNSLKQIGEIIVGFGILFIGINMMTEGLAPLSESEVFLTMFRELGKNPILGVIVGAIVTAIIQSSSASVGILQSLAMSNLVTWNSAVYVIMGQNIGTCITALLSSIGASKNARGAAYIHLLFNVIGSVMFSIFAYIFFTFINQSLGNSVISLTQISLIHTIFNIANTVIMYPFSDILVKIAQKFVAASKGEEDEVELVHLDDRILETPGFAIQNCIKEIVRLGYMAYDNLQLSVESLLDKSEDKIDKVIQREKSIDSLQTAITEYMVKLCNVDINEDENNIITSLFHTVNDLERIGDHSENLVELSQFMISENIEFSSVARNEVIEISSVTASCVENAIRALETNNIEVAKKAVKEEQIVDDIESEFRSGHIKRLANNECDASTGVVFLDILTNLERVSDHALNVAQGVIIRSDKKGI